MSDEEAPNDNIIKLCGVVYFHFFWGLTTILLGIFVMLSRWISKFTKYHPTLGTCWMYCMIIQLYTSIYAGSNGFQWYIFLFGIICYGSLIMGHYFIRLYKSASRSSSSEADPLLETNNGDNYPAKSDKVVAFCCIPMHKQTARNFHVFFMILSWCMLFGAGTMFIRRFSQSVTGCQDLFYGDIRSCVEDS